MVIALSSLAPAVIGVICILLGIGNRRGNLSSLHSYHVKRVKEEDRLPFGRLVGLGMILIGTVLILYAGLSLIASLLSSTLLHAVGTALLILGITVGIGISFYAMFKYNKGIF